MGVGQSTGFTVALVGSGHNCSALRCSFYASCPLQNIISFPLASWVYYLVMRHDAQIFASYYLHTKNGYLFCCLYIFIIALLVAKAVLELEPKLQLAVAS